jgi:outer membrane protein TolC
VQPSTDPAHSRVDDSRARFLVQKRLYDFGRSRSLEDSARAQIDAREHAYLDERQRRRIEIMTRFYEVLLADLRYTVDNEALAHEFVQYDRGRERHRLGQLSDVDLLELEQRFQDARIQRANSQARQSSTRLQLAHALNRPNDLPSELLRPAPSGAREIPDYKLLYEQARQHNPALTVLRKETEAARTLVGAERARRRPVLSAEFEAAAYERELQARDDLRATLSLRIPLYTGGEDSAAIAQALARLHEHEARLAKGEFELRQSVLDLVQELESLKVALEAAKVRNSYRDLYLDRSRALYEMEVRTDLGDAMTRSTEAQWLAAQAEFRQAIAWAKIDALTGQLLETKSQEKQP